LDRLHDKIAVITGCRRGFGEAIARLFAREGALVSICDIVSEEELWENVGARIEKDYGSVLCFQTDVSVESQVNDMVNKTIQEWGSVDILVNNVGIAGPTKAAWELSFDEWNRTLDVNLGGTFLCTKAVVPEMIRKRYGRIINMSSVVFKNPYPYRTPYATSKMGIVGFTRVLALELGRFNITVNAICPGNPGGKRNIEVLRDLAHYIGKSFDKNEVRRRFNKMRETGVLGGKYLREEGYMEALISHDDVARLALFLASNESSSITGQDINVTAGTTMW
jgi:NAD(P)-dependent dehydrogenase (short-subunit alcohol dehydrogenase family)